MRQGGLIGMLLGPGGALAGAAMGALFGATDEIALDDPALDDLAAALDKDTSALILVGEFPTTDIPPQITTPAKVETPIGTLEFFDGVPIGDTTQTVYDYVDRARAVDVFVNMIPAVSMYHMRQGQEGSSGMPGRCR